MPMTELKVVYRKVEDLIPYARNARVHSDAQVAEIAASIKEYGWTNPILLDGNSGIIAGHGRLMAARKLGMDEVPTIDIIGLTDTQKRALILADNKMALNASWDEDMLKLELADLVGGGAEGLVTGFSQDEIDELIGTFDPTSEVEEEELPEPPQEPKSKPGDLWILGNHRLLCGDSTSPDDVARLMGDDRADLWLTDPPYNVSYTGKTKDALTIQNDEMDDESFRRFLVSAYFAADSVLKEGAAFYIWHADSEGFNFRGACRDIGWKVRECLIWVKNAFVMGRQDYQWKHEPCLYGWKEGASHNWFSDRSQSTVLEFARPNRNGEHPTMKPVELFRYLIGNSTRKGQVVLDSFGGSGTTLIACEDIGRKARLIELDPAYCDVIIERWQKFTGQKAIRDSDSVSFDELEVAA